MNRHKFLTCCIHYHKDSQERERNLLATVSYLTNAGIHVFVYVDACEVPSFRNIGSGGLTHIQGDTISECGMPYRTKALNTLMRICPAKYVGIWDADAIVPVEQIDQSLERLVAENMTAVWPYDGYFWKINEERSSIFAETMDLSILADAPDSDKGCIMFATGGAVIVNRQAYRAIGGENESIVGYAPEDAERFDRINKLGTLARIDGPLYHLNHPSTDFSTLDQKYAGTNQEEIRKVLAMKPDDLRRYVESGEWRGL